MTVRGELWPAELKCTERNMKGVGGGYHEPNTNLQKNRLDLTE